MIRRMMMMRSVPSPMYMGLQYPVSVILRRGCVLGLVLIRPRCAPVDHFAGAVRVLRGRVRDHVLRVQQRRVGARAAVDDVRLAVARLEAVVALAAVQDVTRGVIG